MSEANHSTEAEIIEKPETLEEPEAVEKAESGAQAEAEKAEPKVESEKSEAESTAEANPVKSNKPEASKDSATELENLQKAVGGLSVKNTAQLVEFRSRFNRLQKSIKDEESLAAINESLKEKLAANRKHQEKLQEATDALFKALKKALEAGKSHDALPAWDRIQGNISNTSGKIHRELQDKAGKFRDQLRELRDWKAFAATEKKKELLERMQQLTKAEVTDGLEPAELSRRINNLHRGWKKLGRANHDDKLWKQFKKSSDTATKPLKGYFAERKQLLADNLSKREELCQRLEQTLEDMTPEQNTPGELHKLINASEEEWKKYAPVSSANIKEIKARFYGSLNKLRRLRSDHYKEISRQKQELVDKAEALAASDDNRKAMDGAKELQRRWKTLGRGAHREDQKLWKAFRTACDKIFAEMETARAEKKEAVKRQGEELLSMAESLQALIDLDEEALRERRSEAKDLARRMSEISSPELRRKHRKRVENVNTLQRRLDKRLRALPDKKKLLLKQTVQEIADMLHPIEQKLLKCKDAASLEEYHEPLAAIEDKLTVAPSGQGQPCHKVLLERLQQLASAAAPADIKAQATEANNSLRRLCVELEIRADMDTPEADQPMRMQMQLERLQEGLGRGAADDRSDADAAFDAELEALCTGPLSTRNRNLLQKRLDGIFKRLR